MDATLLLVIVIVTVASFIRSAFSAALVERESVPPSHQSQDALGSESPGHQRVLPTSPAMGLELAPS